MQVEATKRCSKCGEHKSHEAFHAWKGKRHPRCKPCRALEHRTYYLANPEKFRDYKLRARGETLEERAVRWERQKAKTRKQRPIIARESHLKRMFGVTSEAYDTLLEKQGGVCAICGTDEPGRGSPHFHIDHCHDTGVVRGLLCNRCNIGLGYFRDDVKRIGAALEYLNSSGAEPPIKRKTMHEDTEQGEVNEATEASAEVGQVEVETTETMEAAPEAEADEPNHEEAEGEAEEAEAEE